MLIKTINFFVFYVIDFDLIPNHLESKEDLLNAAANCYARSLELETNDKNKNNLNRRIGNVYNEITSGYINEISSKFQNHVTQIIILLSIIRKSCFNLYNDAFILFLFYFHRCSTR